MNEVPGRQAITDAVAGQTPDNAPEEDLSQASGVDGEFNGQVAERCGIERQPTGACTHDLYYDNGRSPPEPCPDP